MKNVTFTRPTISKKDLISVLEHLIDEELSNGETVEKFEKELGKTLGLSDRAILTNSGSSALFLIFQQLDIKPGDEVILSPLSNPWVWEVINIFSAKPVWIDISVETLQMNSEQLIKKVTPRTRAVIINHHFGYPFFLNSNLSMQEQFSFSTYFNNFSQVKVIEDLTSALFTRYHNQCLGNFGDYAFTCFENHRIITTGKGGGVFTKYKKDAKDIKTIHSYKEKIALEENQGIKSKRLDISLSDMQAALGLSELSLVEKMINRRKQINKFYQDAIARGKHSFIATDEDTVSNHFAFPLILQGDINVAHKIFNKKKIEIKGITQDTCYPFLPYLEDLPNLHQLKHRVISIPIYPLLKKEEIEKITLLINSIQ